MSTIFVLTLLQKVLIWFYLLCSLDSNAKFSSLCLEDKSNGLYNESPTLSLLEICCPSSSSSPSNVLQFLQRYFGRNFFRACASWKLGVENERRCHLFIVVSKDKLHFELICLKRCKIHGLAQILLRDNYLYLFIKSIF